MPEIGEAFLRIVPKATGIKGELEKEMGGAGESAGKSAGGALAGAIKGAVVAAGIGAVIKTALNAGGDLQQSFGGLETIYGQAAAAAKDYAAQAAQAGISANDYAEQAVSFGAALRQAYGGDTAAAVEAANTAILDMTDNAAKMGTSIDAIQNAYQGFAKQNYTMLDNLKLGYGGTKAEMERLLSDAEALTGVHYDMDNLGDVYAAIHAIQGELGLTGVAAEEASTTLTGSLGAMKAAAENVLAGLATGSDTWLVSLNTLASAVGNFVTNNAIPMVENVVARLPAAVGRVLSNLAPTLLPAGMELLTSVINGFAENVPDLLLDVAHLVPTMADTLLDNLPALIEGGVRLLLGIVEAIPEALPTILDALPGIVARMAEVLVGAMPTILNAALDMLGGILKAIPRVLTSAVGAMQGVGRSLVQGLWNGISNVTSWVLDKIRGFGSAILNGIKGIFGIHSPSTEMAWMGRMLDEGLAQGIDRNRQGVAAAMERLGRDALGGIDVTAPGSRVANLGGVVINVTGAPGQDPNQIADAVLRRLRDLIGDEEAVFA